MMQTGLLLGLLPRTNSVRQTYGIGHADNITKVVVFELDTLPSSLSYFLGVRDFDFSRYYQLTYDVTHDELCDIGAITFSERKEVE